MKYLWAAFIMMFISSSGHARDNYPDVEWGSQFFITTNVNVSSVHKLNKRQKKIVKNTYKQTEAKFFQYWDIDREKCRLGPLTIIIVKGHKELDSKKNFPNENTYADKPGEGGDIIFGRYYSYTNKLFIVPVNTGLYYWRANFSHEVVHYLFDECDIKFDSLEKEHVAIDMFLRDHRHLFY